MMNERLSYDVWAPEGLPWSPWVKPVLFTQSPGRSETDRDPPPSFPPELAEEFARTRQALTLDLRDEHGVLVAAQLLGAGFRPVPLYNTSHAPGSLLELDEILHAMEDMTPALGESRLLPDAPPVFLLDYRRTLEGRKLSAGQYDNRWVVFPQDFPSARYLKEQRIEGVVHVTEVGHPPQEDLAHVLLRWQEEGVRMRSLTLRPLDGPRDLEVQRPGWYKSLFHVFQVKLGLRRNSAGGFGAMIPTANSGGGFA
jgi:hypothetical protein